MFTSNQPQAGYQPTNSTQANIRMQDEDVANVVLAELKRTAEEYTVACLEAQNPQIRNIFQTLLLKTLHDQARLFDIMKSLNLYEAPAMAAPQELQKSIQTKQQTWTKLQTLAQQALQQRYQTAPTGAQQFFS